MRAALVVQRSRPDGSRAPLLRAQVCCALLSTLRRARCAFPTPQVLTSEIERLSGLVEEQEAALQTWQREAELASELAEVSGARYSCIRPGR